MTAPATQPVRLSGHQPGLDGVRGLAILMVMALHFVGDATPHGALQRAAVKLASYGVLGVDLFFVLSGFLITGLLLDAKGAPNYFRNFYARRTLRIFPLYYLVLAFVFGVLPHLTAVSPLFEQARAKQVWLWTYTANFYIAARSSWASLTYVSHFWSLAIEEHFYLLWPLVVFCVRRSTLERVCVAAIAAGLALRIALSLAGMSELSISVLTPCRVDTLCVGALLAALMRRERFAPVLVARAPRLLGAAAAAIFVVSLWCVLARTGLLALHQLRTTLYAILFAGLCLASLRGSGAVARVFRSAPLRLFGKYSYGLYVYHGFLTWYFHEFGAEARFDALFAGHHDAAVVAKAAFAVSLSLAIAVASYELVEKRFLGLKRWFEPGATPAAALVRESRPPEAA